MITISDTTREALGAIEDFRINRDGSRDLGFKGWRIGDGESGSGGNNGSHDWNRGTKVRVYLATGGNVVISWKHWSRWQGEGTRFDAKLCKDLPSVLKALADADDARDMGEAEKEAWEEACGKVDEMSGFDVEEMA